MAVSSWRAEGKTKEIREETPAYPFLSPEVKPLVLVEVLSLEAEGEGEGEDEDEDEAKETDEGTLAPLHHLSRPINHAKLDTPLKSLSQN